MSIIQLTPCSISPIANINGMSPRYDTWYFPFLEQSGTAPTVNDNLDTIIFNNDSHYIILNIQNLLQQGKYSISFYGKDGECKIEFFEGGNSIYSEEYTFSSQKSKNIFFFEKNTGGYIKVTACKDFNFSPISLSSSVTVNFGHPTSPLDIYVDNSVQSKRIRIGSYPENNDNNLFEVGCGTSESNKKNAFSIDDKGIMTSATPLIRIVHHNFSTNTTIAAGSYANFSEQFTYPGEDPSGWRCLGVACFHNGHNQMCSISGYSIYNTAWRYQSGDTQGFKICNPAEKPSVRLCLRNNAGSASAVYNYASGNIASVDLIWGFFGIAD